MLWGCTHITAGSEGADPWGVTEAAPVLGVPKTTCLVLVPSCPGRGIPHRDRSWQMQSGEPGGTAGHAAWEKVRRGGVGGREG